MSTNNWIKIIRSREKIFHGKKVEIS